MTHKEVLSLGWKNRHRFLKNTRNVTYSFKEGEEYDYWIMSVVFNKEYEDGRFDGVMINLVPKDTECNEWENSETHFYGDLKTKEELHIVMRLLSIIKYDSKL